MGWLFVLGGHHIARAQGAKVIACRVAPAPGADHRQDHLEVRDSSSADHRIHFGGHFIPPPSDCKAHLHLLTAESHAEQAQRSTSKPTYIDYNFDLKRAPTA